MQHVLVDDSNDERLDAELLRVLEEVEELDFDVPEDELEFRDRQIGFPLDRTPLFHNETWPGRGHGGNRSI